MELGARTDPGVRIIDGRTVLTADEALALYVDDVHLPDGYRLLGERLGALITWTTEDQRRRSGHHSAGLRLVPRACQSRTGAASALIVASSPSRAARRSGSSAITRISSKNCVTGSTRTDAAVTKSASAAGAWPTFSGPLVQDDLAGRSACSVVRRRLGALRHDPSYPLQHRRSHGHCVDRPATEASVSSATAGAVASGNTAATWWWSSPRSISCCSYRRTVNSATSSSDSAGTSMPWAPIRGGRLQAGLQGDRLQRRVLTQDRDHTGGRDAGRTGRAAGRLGADPEQVGQQVEPVGERSAPGVVDGTGSPADRGNSMS